MENVITGMLIFITKSPIFLMMMMIMNPSLMHRELGNDLLYLRNVLYYSIFFQSTDPDD